MFFLISQCGAGAVLVWLITRRSGVRIPPLLLMKRRRIKITRDQLKTLTLGRLKKLRPSSWRQTISRDARQTFLEQGDCQKCMVCSYSTHVECCHIVDVAQWPNWATISEINDPRNLGWLCPNHHWEFDNGYLDIYAYCPDCAITNKNKNICQD